MIHGVKLYSKKQNTFPPPFYTVWVYVTTWRSLLGQIPILTIIKWNVVITGTGTVMILRKVNSHRWQQKSGLAYKWLLSLLAGKQCRIRRCTWWQTFSIFSWVGKGLILRALLLIWKAKVSPELYRNVLMGRNGKGRIVISEGKGFLLSNCQILVKHGTTKLIKFSHCACLIWGW